MTLFRNGIDLSRSLVEFISSSTDFFIFVPYIKLDPLKQLLDSTNSCKAIVVRWQARDLVFDSSDLEIYDYCKNKNITLYRNSRLHLKAFIDNYKRCFIGSANISNRALNLPEIINYNYEIATFVDSLTLEDRLYFNIILNDSTLITDSVYEQIKSQLLQKQREFPNESEFELKIEAPDKDFLISSLPMTYSVKTLLRICETWETINEVELNCTMHDLALYGLSLNQDIESLNAKLKLNFFEHPFIKGFLNNLSTNQEIYFGAAKDWIHKNCTDVPTPRKWEITENIQILYRWIVELGDGKYEVDQPNYSERLRVLH